MRKLRPPDSVFKELQQQLSCTWYAAGLLSLLSGIERFAEPHQTALARLWLARWRGCAQQALDVRSDLRRHLPDRCEHCGAGSDALMPVAWGYPAPGIEAAQERGEVSHRGCIVPEEVPTWYCRSCGGEQGRPPRQRRSAQLPPLREFTKLPRDWVQRCAQQWVNAAPLSFRGTFSWSPTPSYVRMIDRIVLCSTREQLNALVPEILTYDDEVLFQSAPESWPESHLWPDHSSQPDSGGRLSECIESLRSIWWMAWRALGGALPRSHASGVTAEDLTAVEGLIEHLAHVAHPIRSDWQPLGQLIDDAAHNTEIARLYVAVEATRQWYQEDDLKTRRVQWSESVAALQDNADRLARNRIVHELSNTGPRSAWEPLAQLFEDALNSGDIGRLRIASVALKVWQGRWWEWWQDPAECCLATLKSVHP